MVDEKDDAASDAPATAKKDGKDGKAGEGKGKKKGLNKLLVVLPLALAVTAAGGFYGYTFLSHGRGKAGAGESSAKDDKGKPVLFSLDPFVVNLSEPGRYLKVTMQFEMPGDSNQALVTEKVPILRDTIITLIGSQSYEYVASPEGKLQLKDEIILRTNRAIGKEAFRNLYFTDFVMQ